MSEANQQAISGGLGSSHEVLGSASVSGHLGPQFQIGVGLAVHQGGGYPSEQILDALERHSPGAVGRILAMSEKAQQAQIDATARAQNYTQGDTFRGTWLGTGVTVLAMGLAFGCGILGNTALGIVFLGVPVLSVARALIVVARRQSPPQISSQSNPAPTVRSPPVG